MDLPLSEKQWAKRLDERREQGERIGDEYAGQMQDDIAYSAGTRKLLFLLSKGVGMYDNFGPSFTQQYCNRVAEKDRPPSVIATMSEIVAVHLEETRRLIERLLFEQNERSKAAYVLAASHTKAVAEHGRLVRQQYEEYERGEKDKNIQRKIQNAYTVKNTLGFVVPMDHHTTDADDDIREIIVTSAFINTALFCSKNCIFDDQSVQDLLREEGHDIDDREKSILTQKTVEKQLEWFEEAIHVYQKHKKGLRSRDLDVMAKHAELQAFFDFDYLLVQLKQLKNPDHTLKEITKGVAQVLDKTIERRKQLPADSEEFGTLSTIMTSLIGQWFGLQRLRLSRN